MTLQLILVVESHEQEEAIDIRLSKATGTPPEQSV